MQEEKQKAEATPLTPGQVISPRGAAPPEPQVATPAAPSEAPASIPIETPQESPSFTFSSDTESANSTEPQDGVSWEASEFILHEKNSKWYAGLAGATALISIIIFILTRDLISVAVVIFGSFMFGVYAGRKPRQLPYAVSDQGIQVGNKAYGYNDFRCFSIVPEGAFSSIVLLPLKRFSPLTTIYYPPDQEDKIISIVANYLPMEERSQDSIDKLMHKIGF